MGQTTFSGPVRVGTVKNTVGTTKANVGIAVVRQTATFTFADTGSFASGIVLPAGSQIIDIIVDVTTAWNSVASDALEIGIAADPDEFADVANLQTAGRSTVAIDAAQAAVLPDIGTSDVEIYLTINSAGGSLSTGAARINVLYAPSVDLV